MNASTYDVELFRNEFPSFSIEKYADDRVAFFLTQALSFFDKNKFGQFYRRACNLYTAHNLVIEQRLNKSEEEAFTLAHGNLTVSHKEVGPLYKTESYTNKNTSYGGEGQYGLTIYGKQLYQLIRMAGCSGILYVRG